MKLRYPVALVLSLIAAGGSARAAPQTTIRAPGDLLTRVGFDQHLGAQIPLDLIFQDAQGVTMRLRGALNGRPAVLLLGYYTCANLCDAVRAGVARAVEKSGFVAGKQFNVVLVSIDPHDTPTQADAAQGNDARAHPEAQVQRWIYLTNPRATAALAEALGFRYLFDPRNGQYNHAAGIVVLSPQGAITQYLFGVQFPPESLRLALVNAAQGHIGNIVDRLLLLCCDYDPSTGRYGLLISRVMQGLGALTALTLCGMIVILRRSEWRRKENGRPS